MRRGDAFDPSEMRYDFAGDGIGEEALAMGVVVEFFESGAIGFASFRPDDFRVQIDARDDHFPRIILLEMGHRLIFITFDHSLLHGSDSEKSEHMAAGKGGGERLLRIYLAWVAEVGGRSGGFESSPVFEDPGMIAGIVPVIEVGSVALPIQFSSVCGHRGRDCELVSSKQC